MEAIIQPNAAAALPQLIQRHGISLRPGPNRKRSATVAAVSVSGTTAEFAATDYAPAVLTAAAAISIRLGYGVRAEQRAMSNEQ